MKKPKNLQEYLPTLYVINGQTGCWIWKNAPFQNSGYGRVKHKGKTIVAHRAVYEIFKGSIPGGLQLDHLCRNRICVNPEHLEPVTPYENQRRGNTFTARRSIQTHCLHGHPLSGENLYIKRTGERRCQKCERNRQKLYRQTDKFKIQHAAYERMQRKQRKEKKNAL